MASPADEQIKAGERGKRDEHHDQAVDRQDDVAEHQHVGEGRRNVALVDVPNEHRAEHQHHVEPEQADHAFEHALVEPAEHQPLEHHGGGGDADHAGRQRDHPRQLEVFHQMIKREGAQHGELAVGEVDDAHDPEQQREAERHQDVDRGEADAVDDDLSEDGDVEHRRCPNSRRL